MLFGWLRRVSSGVKLIENRPWRTLRSMVGEQFANRCEPVVRPRYVAGPVHQQAVRR